MAIKGTPRSPNLQHYWNLTIQLFSAIPRTLVEGVLLLCRDVVDVFCCPIRLGHLRFLLSIINIYPTLAKTSVTTEWSRNKPYILNCLENILSFFISYNLAWTGAHCVFAVETFFVCSFLFLLFLLFFAVFVFVFVFFLVFSGSLVNLLLLLWEIFTLISSCSG